MYQFLKTGTPLKRIYEKRKISSLLSLSSQQIRKLSDVTTFNINGLQSGIAKASNSLITHQHKDGHWMFPIEASTFITADYVLTLAFLGKLPTADVVKGLKMSFSRHLSQSGAWALTPNEKTDLSVSVKSYLALRLLGDSPNLEHMRKAREEILKAGGAECVSNLTRFQLSYLELIPWSSVPMIPIELILLPNWFPINIYKLSYWARVNLVPLMILRSLRATPKVKLNLNIDELFIDKKKIEKILPRHKDQNRVLFGFFKCLDIILKRTEFMVPSKIKKRALDKCIEWTKVRINGEDGLGGICLSIMNIVVAYEYLSSLSIKIDEKTEAIRGFEKIFMKKKSGEIFACAAISPQWDTCLAAFALIETDIEKYDEKIEKSLNWLKNKQILNVRGDWSVEKPHIRPGGWTFQYNNDFYPDVDDTAVIIMAMDRYQKFKKTTKYDESINRGLEWIIGMQSKNGGWGAFDANNTDTYLNNIPFADHSALLDPPTVDVTARCISAISQIAPEYRNSSIIQNGVKFLLREQEKNGSWYGRWGVNYIYGTWSALVALMNVGGISQDDPQIIKAVEWLKGIQNEDGGWGESCTSYTHIPSYEHIKFKSTSSQTAWALMTLLVVGEINSSNVQRAVKYLLKSQGTNGEWDLNNDEYTGNGHPNVVYLRYPGYGKYFPLLALAKYRNMMERKGRLNDGF